jgi:hypothetical protein
MKTGGLKIYGKERRLCDVTLPDSFLFFLKVIENTED